jgi:cytidyltransferase-like protein
MPTMQVPGNLPRGEILTLPEAVMRCERWRAGGRRLVFTNGCFDLIHVGHVRYLAAARALGDILVVGLNDDESTRDLKGPGRPAAPLAVVFVPYVTGCSTSALIARLRQP